MLVNALPRNAASERSRSGEKAEERLCCQLCGGHSVKPIYHRGAESATAVNLPAGSSMPKTGYIIVQCLRCGLGFVSPLSPAFGLAADLYGEEYYCPRPLSGRMDDIVNKKQLPPAKRQFDGAVRENRRILMRLQRTMTHSGEPRTGPLRCLDIGCGTGECLTAARELGWSATGTDVAQPAIEFGRNTLGLDVREGFLDEIGFPEASFDIVTLIEVLEHSPDPSGLLEGIHSILSPSGVLYVQVPNDLEGYRARIFAKAWHLIPPVHLQFFTLLSIASLLTLHGFVVSDSGTLGDVGKDLLRYFWWRSGLLGLVDRTHYQTGIDILERGLSRLMSELFGPVNGYLNKRAMGSNLWVCARKI